MEGCWFVGFFFIFSFFSKYTPKHTIALNRATDINPGWVSAKEF